MSKRVLYKDYFDPEEAADYCCVSRAYFDQHIKPHVPLIPLSERKLLFRRSDLQRFIEEKWLRSNGARVAGASGSRT